jgi:hypothetical protein
MSALPPPTIAVALVVLTAGCTGPADRPTAHATTSPSPASTTGPVPATAAPGNGTGCGDTPISPGQLPGWTADAGLPPDVPYAVSREANVVAVLFGYPLRAGHHEDGRNNKILWEMRDPRDGKPLHLTARPPGRRRSGKSHPRSRLGARRDLPLDRRRAHTRMLAHDPGMERAHRNDRPAIQRLMRPAGSY